MASTTYTLNMNGRLVAEDGRLAFLRAAPRFLSIAEASAWLEAHGIRANVQVAW
jgi:hypothetical protein